MTKSASDGQLNQPVTSLGDVNEVLDAFNHKLNKIIDQFALING